MRWLEFAFLPPLNGLLLALCGALFWKSRRGFAKALIALGATAMFAQMLPVVGGALIGLLQVDRPLDLTQLPDADAIVILSAEADPRAEEYGKASVGALTLQRVRYGARLAKATKLPVLVTGGRPREGGPAVALAMRDVLRDEFGVAGPIWVEDRAATTMQNARLAAPLLRAQGCERILLVTHAWHMLRARQCFDALDMLVHAAPTAFHGPAYQGPRSLVPSHGGMRATSWALHEILGRVYYALFA